jgi:hypothetical protein
MSEKNQGLFEAGQKVVFNEAARIANIAHPGVFIIEKVYDTTGDNLYAGKIPQRVIIHAPARLYPYSADWFDLAPEE